MWYLQLYKFYLKYRKFRDGVFHMSLKLHKIKTGKDLAKNFYLKNQKVYALSKNLYLWFKRT